MIFYIGRLISTNYLVKLAKYIPNLVVFGHCRMFHFFINNNKKGFHVQEVKRISHTNAPGHKLITEMLHISNTVIIFYTKNYLAL